MKLHYRHTAIASYIGYVTQAIVNNFGPLLFLTFHNEFGISLNRLTILISLNFGIQLLVDLAATRFVDKIGYRATAVMAHVFAFFGLLAMGTLPYLLASPYLGLLIAITINAVGGGLTEVIISPIVEALPVAEEKKAGAMSLLHSFYCWGFVLVVAVSTVYFQVAGIGRWRWLAVLWALVPLCNAFLFGKVPIRNLISEDEAAVPLRRLFSQKAFLILFVLMICSGASEQAMAQWASFFAEVGLGVSKTMGDLLGPCLFAVLMGISRVAFSRMDGTGHIERVLFFSSCLCIGSYLVTVFSPFPLLSLLGCGVCGLSVGVMWPGTFSLASKHFPRGGTAMFAILALAGDVGCGGGPGLVGALSSLAQSGPLQQLSALFPGNGEETRLKTGLLFAIVFPALLAMGVSALRRGAGRADEG